MSSLLLLCDSLDLVKKLIMTSVVQKMGVPSLHVYRQPLPVNPQSTGTGTYEFGIGCRM